MADGSRNKSRFPLPPLEDKKLYLKKKVLQLIKPKNLFLAHERKLLGA